MGSSLSLAQTDPISKDPPSSFFLQSLNVKLEMIYHIFDYKMHVPPLKFGRKMGVCLTVQMWLTWLAGVGVGGQWWSGFFLLFSSSKT